MGIGTWNASQGVPGGGGPTDPNLIVNGDPFVSAGWTFDDGWTGDDVAEKATHDGVSRDGSQFLRRSLREALGNGSDYQFTCEFENPGGQTVFVTVFVGGSAQLIYSGSDLVVDVTFTANNVHDGWRVVNFTEDGTPLSIKKMRLVPVVP